MSYHHLCYVHLIFETSREDHELDDGGVPLLVATHAPRTESLREADTRRGPGVHGEAGDDDILTVAVTEMSG